MPAEAAIIAVRGVLQQFQDGYAARDLSRLNELEDLFAQGPDVELIGIGASARGGAEWFEGPGKPARSSSLTGHTGAT